MSIYGSASEKREIPSEFIIGILKPAYTVFKLQF